MDSMKSGYVYILTNPSFKDNWVKIGKSSRPVDIRSKELDNTAVPLPFEIFATMMTSKYNEVEKLVHKTIDRLTDLRIRQNREFFNVSPQTALDIFRDIAHAIDDAVIIEYEDNSPIDPETDKVSTLSCAQHVTDTGKLQLQFWTEFNKNSYKNSEFSHNFKLRKVFPQHWYDLSVGLSGLHICLTVSRQKKEITAGIYIDNDKGLYSKFFGQEQEISACLNGATVHWRESTKAARFFVRKDFDIDDDTKWDEAFLWLYDMCLIFKKIVSKYGK